MNSYRLFTQSCKLNLIILFIIFFSHNSFAKSLSLDEFNTDQNFDIYYEVSSFEVANINNVKILGIASIKGIDFLAIKSSGFNDKSGYILYKTVRAIIPSGSIQPQRVFANSE